MAYIDLEHGDLTEEQWETFEKIRWLVCPDDYFEKAQAKVIAYLLDNVDVPTHK